MIKISILCLFVLFVAGCGFNVKKTEIVKVETRIERPAIFHPALPNKISLPTVVWRIMTPELIENYIIKYRAGDVDGLVLYTLEVDQYEQLTENTAKIKKLLLDNKEIIIYYRSLE